MNLYYEVHGEGPPLVLIAGFLGDHTSWQYVLKPLSRQFSVIIFDNPGVGKSDMPKDDYSLDDYACDIRELLKFLKIENAHILGTSMGGMIAQRFAINYASLVNKLVLVSTSAHPLVSVPGGLPYDYLDKTNKELVAANLSLRFIIKNSFAWLFSNQFLDDDAKVEAALNLALEQAKMITPTGRRIQHELICTANNAQQLHRIKAETLVLTGASDLRILPKESEFLAKHIPNAELKMIPHCGHLTMIEKPNQFVELVVNFLRHPIIPCGTKGKMSPSHQSKNVPH